MFLDGHDTVTQTGRRNPVPSGLARHVLGGPTVRRLFLPLLVSADGFFDGPNREPEWLVVDDEYFEYVEDDAGFAGRGGLNPPPALTAWNELGWLSPCRSV